MFIHLGFQFGLRSMKRKARGGNFPDFLNTTEAEAVLVFLLMVESAIC